jgi:hypothetical protein
MILGLMFAKPFRSFKTIVPGLDPRHSYTMGALRRLTSFGGTEVAVARGVEAGIASTSPRPANQPTTRAEEESLPPLPRVTWRGGAAANPAAAAGQTVRAPSAEPRQPVWFGAGVPAPAAATVASAGAPAVVRPPAVVVTPVVLPVMAAGGNVSGAARSEVPRRQVVNAGSPTSTGNGVARQPVAVSGASLTGLAGPAATRTTTATGDRVAEPVYARPATHVSESVTAPGELVLADKQVDPDGREVFVIYHRGDTYAGAA